MSLQDVLDVLLSVGFLSPVVGFLVAFTVGMIIHLVQRRRSHILPYLPSYVDALDSEHDSATLFFAAVHDMAMCVTEAWNTKNTRRTDGGSVETQLHHDQLYRACDGVLAHGQALMEELVHYDTLASDVFAAQNDLDASWEYTSRDNYRTEYYTETSTDSEGNTTTETKSRQVYEDTDHWFTYDAAYATSAHRKMKALRKGPHAR